MPRPSSSRPGFLSSFTLARNDEAVLHDHARTSALKLVEACRPNKERWKVVKNKPDVIVWEEKRTSTKEQSGPTSGDLYTIRSCCIVNAPADEVMKALDGSKTNTYRSFMRNAYGSTFADAAVLHHRNLNDHESLAVNWLAYRCRSPLVYDLDFCLVEYTNRLNLTNAGGCNNQVEEARSSDSIYDDDLEATAPTEPVAYSLVESVRTKHCPLLLESHNLERADMVFGGYVLFPTNHANKTRVMYVASVHQPPVQIRRRANIALFQNIAFSLRNLKKVIEAFRIHTKVLTLHEAPIDISSSIACTLCFEAFTHFRRKCACRGCGNVVCRNCTEFKEVDLPNAGLFSSRICKSCISGLQGSTPASSSQTPPLQLPEASDPATKSPSSHFSPKYGSPKTTQTKAKTAQSEWFQKLHLVSPPKNAIPQKSFAAPTFPHDSPAPSSPARSLMPRTKGVSCGSLNEREMEDFNFSSIIDKRKEAKKGNNNTADMAQDNPSLLDTPYKDILKVLCELACDTLHCQYAAVTLTDPDEHYLKSTRCDRLLSAPKNLQCCAPVIASKQPTIVLDTETETMWQSLPIVKGPHKARFYAGAPLGRRKGKILGAVCVFDSSPRQSLDDHDKKVMENLAHLAVVSIEERRRRLLSLIPKNPTQVAGRLSQVQDLQDLLPEDTKQTPEIRMINMLFKAQQSQKKVRETRLRFFAQQQMT